MNTKIVSLVNDCMRVYTLHLQDDSMFSLSLFASKVSCQLRSESRLQFDITARIVTENRERERENSSHAFRSTYVYLQYP